MKAIVKYLLLSLALISCTIKPAAAPSDVDEQEQTQAAIQASQQDPAEVRAQLRRQEAIEEFNRQEAERLQAEREKKRGTLPQLETESGSSSEARALPQEEIKEEEEKERELKLYPPYEDPELEKTMRNLPNVLSEYVEKMAQPKKLFETNAEPYNSVIIEGNDELIRAISPDDRFLATASNNHNGFVYIRDSTTGELLHKPIPFIGATPTLAISKNNLIAIISGMIVHVWDANTGTLQYTLTGHTRAITSVAFSNDNSFIVTGSIDNTARIWESADGSLRHAVAHTDQITSVAISPDNSFIVTGSLDEARVWDPITGTPMVDADTGFYVPDLEIDSPIATVLISSNNKFIVVLSANGDLSTYNARTGELLYSITDVTNRFSTIAISPNNKFFVDASDTTTRIWNINNGQLIRELKGEPYFTVNIIIVSSDSRLVITKNIGGRVKIWSSNDGQLLYTLSAPAQGYITSVLISSNMEFMVTTERTRGEHYVTRIWRTKRLPKIAEQLRKQEEEKRK